MKDIDVRKALRRELDHLHLGDDRTLIVEEMGIWSGSVRIDVAVVNGELHGFEIKSARDTLTRLPAQQELYSQVFDRVTLVVADRHIEKSSSIVPGWWGIMVAKDVKGDVALSHGRAAVPNPNINPLQIARLLWRQELCDILDRYQLLKGYRGAGIEKLSQRAAGELPLATLRHDVRETLKNRSTWSRQSVEDKRKVTVGIDLDPLCSSPGAA